MATEPKLSDRIVFQYEQANLKLNANRLTSDTAKKYVTWHSKQTDEDPDEVFTVNLDTTNTRANTQQAVKFNKAGVYLISCSLSKSGTGATTMGMTFDLKFPNGSPFEIAYQEQSLGEFYTIA